METNQEKIIGIIKNGSLSAHEIELWRNVLKDMPENISREILLALEKDSNQLIFLTENLKEKLDAVTNKNIQKWNKILEKEKVKFNQ